MSDTSSMARKMCLSELDAERLGPVLRFWWFRSRRAAYRLNLGARRRNRSAMGTSSSAN